MTEVQQYPNWFSAYADRFFEKFLTPLAGQPDLRFLQIGAFTGDASMWLLDNVLTGDGSVLVDVDTWQGSDEAAHDSMDFADVERVYDERTAEARTKGRLFKFKATSAEFFAAAIDFGQYGRYDFIYIDGAHDAYTVLNDGVSAYDGLALGGLLAFDDYLWESGKGFQHDPRPAIDAIGACYQGRLALQAIGAQAWFRRVA